MVILSSTKKIYLGNKLLLFAHFIASGIEHNYKIKNPSFGPYSRHFEGPDKTFISKFPSNNGGLLKLRWLRNLYYTVNYKFVRLLIKLRVNNGLVKTYDIGWEQQCDINDSEYIKLVKSTKRIYLQGWHYRSNDLVVKHKDQIKEYFKPKSNYLDNIERLFDINVRKDSMVVGVHIRQGDFKTYLDGKYYFESIKYAKWMKEFESLFPGRKIDFLVCSNEEQDYEVFEGLNIFPGTGDFIEDMYALAKCDYIIGVASTFALWASFYGDTPVFILKDQNQKLILKETEMFPFSIDG